ncbi:endonuclease domain-containing protein [Sinomicrobium pectinilyticum]|uniref:Endonuclease domain-containing protein n=1 Tax=Sinomicrobium pectinilyticum TaxID=1084421 RepID=A0A3N0E199_SINP1|nr:endonuclease domain-containing protein [Sinomicrobium pectinilyticum]RNL81615.1 endonuclease domain-containing protein [Sinomicrobium pectinilyticum]
MKKTPIHNLKQLREYRTELRKNMTPAEAFLWKHIKARKIHGYRFTRQHSIGNYIVDFYCAKACLIIELDGEVHNNPQAEEYDFIRTKALNKKGYTVLRFENKIVFENLDAVLQEIKEHLKE